MSRHNGLSHFIQAFKMHVTGNNIPFSQINLTQSLIHLTFQRELLRRLSRKCPNFFNKTSCHLRRRYLALSPLNQLTPLLMHHLQLFYSFGIYCWKTFCGRACRSISEFFGCSQQTQNINLQCKLQLEKQKVVCWYKTGLASTEFVE